MKTYIQKIDTHPSSPSFISQTLPSLNHINVLDIGFHRFNHIIFSHSLYPSYDHKFNAPVLSQTRHQCFIQETSWSLRLCSFLYLSVAPLLSLLDAKFICMNSSLTFDAFPLFNDINCNNFYYTSSLQSNCSLKLLSIDCVEFKFAISYSVNALDNKPIMLQLDNIFNKFLVRYSYNPVTEMANFI